MPQRRGTDQEFRAARNNRYYSKKTQSQGRESSTRPQPNKSYNPAAVNRRERRLKAKLRASEAETAELRERLKSVEERNAAEKILAEAEHEESLATVLEELEELRSKAKEQTSTQDSRALDFKRPDGSYRSDFTLMCAKVLNAGVAASRASAVIEIVIEFVTKKKLVSKPSARTHGRITKVPRVSFQMIANEHCG